jgi:hypothetical protein
VIGPLGIKWIARIGIGGSCRVHCLFI